MRRWSSRQLILAGTTSALWLITVVSAVVEVWAAAAAALSGLILFACLMLIDSRAQDARTLHKLNLVLRRQATHRRDLGGEIRQGVKQIRSARDRIDQTRDQIDRSGRDILDEIATFKLQQAAIIQQLTEIGHRSRDVTADSLGRAFADQEAAVRRGVGELGDQLERLSRTVESDVATTAATDGLQRDLKAMRAEVDRLAYEPAREVESAFQLFRHLEPTGLMPTSGGWAMSPSGLLLLTQLVEQRRPATIVECGCGTSSVWLGYAIRRLGHGHVYSLENDLDYAASYRAELERHGLSDWVTVIDAPLQDFEIDGEPYRWYEAASYADVHDIDLLIVDGPPATVGPLSRFPAVPLLEDRLSVNGLVVLDDAVRPDEKRIMRRWQERNPSITVEPFHTRFQAVLSTSGVNEAAG